jgi:pilus assembly protein CpaB
MNRTRLLMIGAVALALGAFVSLIVYKNLQGRGSSSGEPGVDVIIAANDIQVGARVEEHDVRIVKYPASALPASTYGLRSKVLGRGVILPIAKGEFILPSKLAPENAGSGLPSLIPPGMRAVSVRVNEVVSVAGFVGPGTRVDILLTGTPNGSSENQTTTVLQNVAVIAAGQRLERNASGDAQNTPVITLLVSPDDAERLTLASSEGHIQLALRNPLDTQQDDVTAANAKGLYKGGTVSAPTPLVHARPVRLPKTQTPPPAPSVLSIEVYQGDKKPDVVKFPEQGSEEPKQ